MNYTALKFSRFFATLILSVFLAVSVIYAQTPEPTPLPTPTPEISPTPTPEISPRETPTPTPEKTPEISPTPTPEKTPEVSPTPTPEKTPEVSPTPTPEPNSASEAEPKPEITPTPTPEILAEVVSEDLIHFGDEIEIDIVGNNDFDWRGTVDSEGFFSQLPYVDVAIYAVCRTEKEVGNALSVAYAKYFRNPEVSVKILDRSKRSAATLLGAVKKEQRLSIRRPIRLNELLILAGGITENASGEVTVFRPLGESCEPRKPNQGINIQTQTGLGPGSDGTANLARERIVRTKAGSDAVSPFTTIKITDLVAGKEAANPFIRSGDVVKVEEASPIYVTGAVNAPQKVFFRQQITVTRAISTAGGLQKNKVTPQIVIYRRDKETKETKIIEVDLAKIQLKLAPDVPLEAFDIIEVIQNVRAKNVRPPVVDDLEKPKPAGTLPLKIIN